MIDKKNLNTLLVRMKNGTVAFENSLRVNQKVKQLPCYLQTQENSKRKFTQKAVNTHKYS